ncbi:MAG: hypothetical protein J4F42_04885 [Desulfurellaceae bacterium]|nr:hypothetical protein [Desulfurellaceae bacterium]
MTNNTNPLSASPQVSSVSPRSRLYAATLPGTSFLTGLIVELTDDWNMVCYPAAGVMLVGIPIWNVFVTGETLFD